MRFFERSSINLGFLGETNSRQRGVVEGRDKTGPLINARQLGSVKQYREATSRSIRRAIWPTFNCIPFLSLTAIDPRN